LPYSEQIVPARNRNSLPNRNPWTVWLLARLSYVARNVDRAIFGDADKDFVGVDRHHVFTAVRASLPQNLRGQQLTKSAAKLRDRVAGGIKFPDKRVSHIAVGANSGPLLRLGNASDGDFKNVTRL
jgi:hypothetical protein